MIADPSVARADEIGIYSDCGGLPVPIGPYPRRLSRMESASQHAKAADWCRHLVRATLRP